MGRKINWAKIRRDYVTGDVSQKQLAAEYHVSPSDVSRHSKLEGWVQKRAEHRAKVGAKSVQKIADKQAASLARIIDLTDRVADQIEQMLEAELRDPELLLSTRMHNRELESKVNALTKLYELKARHFGMMTPRDAAHLKLEREKFEYEQKRDAENSGDKDTEVKVVFSGEMEEFSE